MKTYSIFLYISILHNSIIYSIIYFYIYVNQFYPVYIKRFWSIVNSITVNDAKAKIEAGDSILISFRELMGGKTT